MNNSEINISAFQLELNDLDEYDNALQLSRLIEENDSPALRQLILDLRKCNVGYPQSSIFLDTALSILKKKDLKDKKTLRIKTSINFGPAEAMASIFFQVSNTLSCKTTDDPKLVVERIDEFCTKANINIALEIFKFDKNLASDIPSTTHNFPRV